MQRPNRRLGEVLRAVLGCPLCRVEPADVTVGAVRVVSYRASTVRVECVRCGLRFTMNLDDVLRVVSTPGSYTNAFASVVYFRDDLDDVREVERDRKHDQRHPSAPLPDEVVRLDADLSELSSVTPAVRDTGGQ
jgi:transcription elongation factor Elf1